MPPQERYCPGLAEEERRQLRAFSARRRQEALGQGLACPVPGPCHGCPCRKVRWPLQHPFSGGEPSPKASPAPNLVSLCLAVRPEAEQRGPGGFSFSPGGSVLAPVLLLLPLLPAAAGGSHLLPAGWEDLLRPAPRRALPTPLCLLRPGGCWPGGAFALPLAVKCPQAWLGGLQTHHNR